MKAVGTNTAISTSEIAITAVPTSSMVRCAAALGSIARGDVALDVLDHDDRIVDDDADRQHQAEQRQHVEREAERRRARRSVPISDTGIATIGTIAMRQDCRKTMMTMTTSTIASKIVL